MIPKGAGRAMMLGVALSVAACARAPRVSEMPRGAARSVRVVVAAGVAEVAVSSPNGLDAVVGRGTSLLTTAAAPLRVRVTRGALSVVDAPARLPRVGTGDVLVLASRGNSHIVIGGRRYRGVVRLVPTDSGVLAINELPVEQYLRGVVPLEIGARREDERGAIEAQAVAARSFTYVRLRDPGARSWDLRATSADQVYGGVEAERAESDAAIAATSGLVLMFGGRVVDAPYSASCGGETAGNDEVYRSVALAYLRPVSDRRPGASERYWCDIGPSFRWERVLTADSLQAGLERHLRTYVSGLGANIGVVSNVSVTGRTPSGRAAGVQILTAAGERWVVQRNEVRFVLRPPGGAIVPSTYLSIESEMRSDGTLSRVMITGRGNGHGVGMCQWGAIGRARAGQDARTILRTYYPGTELRRVD